MRPKEILENSIPKPKYTYCFGDADKFYKSPSICRTCGFCQDREERIASTITLKHGGIPKEHILTKPEEGINIKGCLTLAEEALGNKNIGISKEELGRKIRRCKNESKGNICRSS